MSPKLLPRLPALFLLLLGFGGPGAPPTPLAGQGTLLTAAAGQITLENCARINTPGVQFGPAIYGENLVFVARPRRGPVNPRTQETFFTFFRAPLAPDGTPGRPKRFSTELSSNYNEGPASFANDDRVIYFTRTQLNSGTTVEDARGRAHLGIFSAYRAQYDWADVRALPFNGRTFSNQHPSASPDGRRIFFASNRPGGYGGYDLYFSDFRGGQWGAAINLGPEINTEGDEAFPHFHPSGRLFFSSNGHGGRGGHDLFMIDLSERRWGKLYNLPEPLNGPADDVGLVLTPDAGRGFLVSNREGGMGKDDIYLLRLAEGLASLAGPSTEGETVTIIDGATSQRLAGAEVWIAEVGPEGRLPAAYYSFAVGEDGRVEPRTKPLGELPLRPFRTDERGILRTELTEGRTYELRAYYPGFAPATLRFAYRPEGPSRPLVLTLDPRPCRLVSGRVTDPAGAGVGGAAVRLSSDPAVATRTDLGGYYELCLAGGQRPEFTVTAPDGSTAHQSLPREQLITLAHPRVNFVLPAGGARGGQRASSPQLPLPGVVYYGRTSMLSTGHDRDLRLLVELLRQRPDYGVNLLVHTDGPEPTAELRRLSEARAATVARALADLGVSPDRVRTVAYANEYRIRNCGPCTDQDYRSNSRVEARLVGH